MFLTPEHLVELTDRRRSSDQTRWLRDHGYRFDVGASGRPKVLLAEVERHLLGDDRPKASEPRLELVKSIV